MDADPPLTPKQVAAYFGYHVKTIYVWIKNGDLAYLRIHNRIFIRPADLKRLERSSTHRPENSR